MNSGPVASATINDSTLAAAGSQSYSAREGHILAAVCGRPRIGAIAEAPDPARKVLAAYRKFGSHIVDHIHGSFALVVIDSREGTTFLATDRLGIQPLYYTIDGAAITFASRADSLAAHPGSTRELDPQALFDYLYFHCVPAPRAIHRNQQKLLPAQCLTFRAGQVRTQFYWALHYQPSAAGFPELRDRFLSVLRESVQRASDDGSTGAFLSGGTDSSTVSGLLAQLTDKPPRTYSIGFEASGYDEIEYARIASRHFGTEAHEYYVTPQDVVDAIPLIATAYDEPFGNASAVPTYYCARNAHADGTAALLAGDGGDELFAGNARYARQLMFEQYLALPAMLRKGLLEPLAFGVPGLQRVAPVRKLRSYIEQALVPLPDRLESYNFFHRTLPAEILAPDFLQSVDTSLPLAGLREVYERTSSPNPLYSMLHLDLKITLADNDLRKVTRMCELAGVEVRYPLLDEAVVEFSGQLPPGLLLRRLKLRHFFKKALADFLPPEILNKSKHGFGLPFGVWLLEYTPLRELAYDSLETLKGRGYLQARYIDKLRHAHQTDDAAYYGVMIWVLMILEHWFQAHGH
ncbi:MAG: asparagine synthase-related protein [Gammaproteobacteria bacterium]